MIDGPKLTEGQLAVLMCDGATGHVLTTEGKVYLLDKSPVYFVFDDMNVARNYIRSFQEMNNTLEFTIYDCKDEFVEFWKSPKWT